MSSLADAVLPLIRTRADLHRWSAANAHGRQMHEAVDILEDAVGKEDPTTVLTVTQKAIASAEQIIVRAREAAEREHAQMRADLKREIGRLVVQTTASVTGKVLTTDDQRRLAEETARSLPQ